MFDLEQYLGQSIDWVTGETFDSVVKNGGGLLPSPLRRFCTVEMKLRPMYRWWNNHCNIGSNEAVKMQIGFRAGEEKRANRMRERCNENGILEFKDVIGKHSNGRNKWATKAWQKPVFPMIEDGIHRDKVVEFWKGKPVRFAERNNCVGCFHRNPILLRDQFDKHPEKMEWFANKERNRKLIWDKWSGNELTYDQIKRHKLQFELSFDDFNDCDSGHCGL